MVGYIDIKTLTFDELVGIVNLYPWFGGARKELCVRMASMGAGVLSEEELAYYRRGKNSHVHAVPKGATPAEYGKATGLEALFGALYLSGQTQRLNQLFHIIIEETEG